MSKDKHEEVSPAGGRASCIRGPGRAVYSFEADSIRMPRQVRDDR